MQIFLPELRDQVYIEINAVLVLGLGLHLTPKEFIVDVEHGAEQEQSRSRAGAEQEQSRS